MRSCEAASLCNCHLLIVNFECVPPHRLRLAPAARRQGATMAVLQGRPMSVRRNTSRRCSASKASDRRRKRALALASELVHGTAATMRDPARFAFAHGGKDGTPFPVDKPTYDRTIEVF